jgi:hypothetical protein
MEACGQYVDEKAADELVGGKSRPHERDRLYLSGSGDRMAFATSWLS